MSMLSLGLVTEAVTEACGGMLTMLSSCGRDAGLGMRGGSEAGSSSSSDFGGTVEEISSCAQQQ